VADVVWASPEFMKKHRGENPFSVAPEICIEVVSPGNTKKEMDEKRKLYLENGAKEFWLCDQDGRMVFHDLTGMISNSKVVPQFPSFLDLEKDLYLVDLKNAIIEAKEERAAKEKAETEVERYRQLLLDQGIDPSK
jgi:Uma2 family endonuclease